jgi:hypothetical protein
VSAVITPIAPAPEPASASAYQAGACNIGPFEIRRRRASGLLGVGAAAVFGAALVAIGAPAPARLLVLLPLWGGLIGLLQARRRFCVGFAVAGIANLADDAGGRVTVAQVDRAANLAASRRLVLDALLMAAPVAVAFALLALV